MRARVLLCLMVLGMAASTALASSGGTLTWAYQLTGYRGNSSWPQTALAMRDGEAWPVIFSQDYSSMMIQAYSLYPVTNTQTQTNWFKIGTNLATYQSGQVLSAATSPDGRVGVVVRTPNTTNYSVDTAVVGGSTNGFGTATSGVWAIAFDSYGNLVTGTASTVYPPQGVPMVDIAVSPLGDLGVVDQNGLYYQKSSLLGGWASQTLGLPTPTPYSDLAFDSLSRPHVVSALSGSSVTLIASDFDIGSGTWKHQTLSSTATTALGAAIAADSRGGVGAAWVQSAGSGTYAVEYAYKIGTADWTVQTVTTSVYNPLTSGTDTVSLQARVGLAFDANDFPVISFLAGSAQNIYLAYDPPAAVPEPSTLVLAAAGGGLALLAAGRSRRRRLPGK
jgi:hypothetical protein